MRQAKKVYLITGCTGFIGHLLVRYLIRKDENLYFILPVRNIDKAKKMYGDILEHITFINSAIEKLKVEDIRQNIDYIIHCASITNSSKMIYNPVEVADGIVIGTKSILEIARLKKVKSMVYLSSMEIYGEIENTGRKVTENELGCISLSLPRSSYPLGKRMAEHYCYIYNYQYNVPVKIARLSQIFGKGVLPGDSRVFVQFAKAVIEKKDIVLHTNGMSMGNYCESYDAIKAIELILHKGINGEVYNVVNEANTMLIRDMANLVSENIANGKIKVIFENGEPSKYGYAPNTGLILSAKKLYGLGWRPTKGLEQMYLDLIDEIKSK